MSITNGYFQSDNERKINILNLPTLEKQAQEIIPEGGFGYITSGAENEWTLNENTRSFDDVQIMPRVLSNVENPTTETEVYGIKMSMPIMMAPAAAQGLAHTRGEMATAEGMAKAGTIMAQSTYGNTTIADTAKAGNGAPQFFQLYMSKDWDVNKSLLDEAVKAGVKAIILTVDATVGGYREADIRTGFQFPLPMANLEKYAKESGTGKNIGEIYAAGAQKIGPDDVKKIVNYVKIPVIVKGIQDPDDAEAAIKAGAQGIWVSNHGGRQLDGGPASFKALESVAKRVNKRVPVFFDSGVRRGSHVFKALASGADVVALARPVIYGLALGGAQGVQSVMEHLNNEFKTVMQLAGTQDIEAVKNAKLIK